MSVPNQEQVKQIYHAIFKEKKADVSFVYSRSANGKITNYNFRFNSKFHDKVVIVTTEYDDGIYLETFPADEIMLRFMSFVEDLIFDEEYREKIEARNF